MLLIGKTTIVYGASGSVGSAVAKAFAREGAFVILAGRQKDSLERTLISIQEAGGNAVVWIGEYDIGIQELLQGSSTSVTVLSRAEKLINEMLTDGPILSENLFAKAKEQRISGRTLKTAKKKLSVKSIKTVDGWKWQL